MAKVEDLAAIGKEVTHHELEHLPKELEHVGFIIINCYKNTKYTLCDGPLNDGYNMAKCLNRFGFDIFYIIDSKKEKFLEKLKYFFERVTKQLVIYYVGHGTNVRDTDGDEDDGYDEAMFFVNGPVVDDVLIGTLCQHKNPQSKVVLVTDACHSGTIWDIQSGNFKGRALPPRIISVSAASDKQTAKQTVREKVEQGMFTYNLMKLLKANPNLNARDVKRELKTALEKYSQTCTIATTSAELIDEPLFTFTN